MTAAGFLSLAAQSVTAPREVARMLLALRLSREALLTAFALVVVLNALAFSASLIVAPAQNLPAMMTNPAAFLGIQAAALLASIFAFTWAGQSMGGEARAEELAVLLIWLQALRALVQAGAVVLIPLSAGLAGLLLYAANALGVWILVNFIDEAHGFDNLMKSLLVMVLGVLGIALAMTLLLTLAGVGSNGTLPNV